MTCWFLDFILIPVENGSTSLMRVTTPCFISWKTSQERQTSKIYNYEIFHEIWNTKGLKYEICMKFNGILKFATEIWNIDVILLSDRPLVQRQHGDGVINENIRWPISEYQRVWYNS